MRARHEALPNQEELLVDFARRLQRHRVGRIALWLHLSWLLRENRHENDIHLAANLLRPLARNCHGEVFELASGDVVVCLKEPPQPKIDAALFQVRYSFAHDPLMRRADDEGDAAFVRCYEITRDFDEFLRRCEEELASVTKTHVATPPSHETKISPSTSMGECSEQTHGGLGPRLILSPARGASVSSSVSPPPEHFSGAVKVGGADIPFVRLTEREVITEWREDGTTEPVGVKLSVPERAIENFGALSLALARGQITLKSALGEIERAVAPELARVLGAESGSIGLLTLRLDTVMTPEFTDVISVIEGFPEASIWVALDAEDVRVDLDTAGYIHGFLQRKGIPVGIAGLSPAIAKSIVRFLAGLSFAEIIPAGAGSMPAPYVSGLIRLLDVDNILIGKQASHAARKEARAQGARRFIGPVG